MVHWICTGAGVLGILPSNLQASWVGLHWARYAFASTLLNNRRSSLESRKKEKEG